MQDPIDHPDQQPDGTSEEPHAPDPLEFTSRPRKWSLIPALFAWLVIIGAVVFITGFQHIRPGLKTPDSERAMEDVVQTMQSRYIVAAGRLLGGGGQAQQLYEQAEMLNTGPVDQRLRYVALTGELTGPQAAEEQLRDLVAKAKAQGIELTQGQQELIDILHRLYADYEKKQFDAPSLSEEDRTRLRKDLGWFGELALTPPDDPDQAARREVLAPAWKTLFTVVGLATVLLGLGGAGFVGLIVLLALLICGRLRGGLTTGVIPHGVVYAETFALWMLLFLGLSYGASFIVIPGWGLMKSGIATLLSLVALAWPVIRGVPWRQVREDIGLTWGRRGALEPLLGLPAYALSVPFVGVGMLITLLLMRAYGMMPGFEVREAADKFTSPTTPSHPIVPLVVEGTWGVRLQILFLASVVAPIVEETMFRGVLYRHVREATGDVLGRVLSVVASVLVVSFIFAAIHPQGWLAVPMLMGIAIGFNLIREWRGTLLPAMVAHGLNNAIMLTFAILALGA